MKLRELLEEVLEAQEDAVKQVLHDVLLAEQQRIDMERPRGIIRDVEKAIDDQARREEASR